MSGWGNGIERPWHERPQPSRLMASLGEIGWSGEVADDSIPPGGRTAIHAVTLRSYGGYIRGQAWFRGGSFVGGMVGEKYHRAQPVASRMSGNSGIRTRTPNDGLTRFLKAVREVDASFAPPEKYRHPDIVAGAERVGGRR